MEKVYMQITSGRGPAECCRVVALVLEKILKQAAAKGVKTEIVERETGPLNRTLLSAVISLQGGDYHALIEDWEGTVQWIAKSSYRIYHKRKNWFVGVQTFTLSESQEATEAEIRYETLRASGPGRSAREQDGVCRPCRPYSYRNERGSFRPTLAMAKQETGHRTPAVETGIMEHRASHDSSTGQLE